MVCKELGQEPDLSKKPIDFSELSSEAISQIEIYNQMQDTYLVPGMSAPIYTGKDYNNLTVLFQIYQVPEDSRVAVLEMINIIDEEPIKRARELASKQARKNRIAPTSK